MPTPSPLEKQLVAVPSELPPSPPDSSHSDAESYSKDEAEDISPANLPSIPASSPPTEVLEVDKKTPDGWLPRDPRLIRLTGVHPFNVEAPLSDLFNEGFITSPELFYVRNHGHVPQVQDDEILSWELTVEGLVERPFSITLRDILEQYEQRTYPITLVCAGNRRKEQNVVRKTKGFSWGAAGVSTALFTGIHMADLLERARPRRGARYVCMEGADELPNGCYGTNVKLRSAMDRDKGTMIAHAMNGEMLRPDHGKPLRAVIPGQIGGRSVKWLKRLIVTPEPSDNWYHIWDNRVLPTMISPEESANKPSWWEDERYAIYDLSTNSAVTVGKPMAGSVEMHHAASVWSFQTLSSLSKMLADPFMSHCSIRRTMRRFRQRTTPIATLLEVMRTEEVDAELLVSSYLWTRDDHGG